MFGWFLMLVSVLSFFLLFFLILFVEGCVYLLFCLGVFWCRLSRCLKLLILFWLLLMMSFFLLLEWFGDGFFFLGFLGRFGLVFCIFSIGLLFIFWLMCFWRVVIGSCRIFIDWIIWGVSVWVCFCCRCCLIESFIVILKWIDMVKLMLML